MKKRIVILAAMLLVVFAALAACKKEDGIHETTAFSGTEAEVQTTEEKTLAATAAEKTEPVTTTVAPTTKAPETTEGAETTTAEEDDGVPKIIWAASPLVPVNADAQKAIENKLKERGIECKIEYVNIPTPEISYSDWLEERRSEGTFPDILSTNFWHAGVVECYVFAKAELCPLNDLLESEEGRELYEAFTEVEWKQVEHDGKIYTIPQRNGGAFYSGELYLYVNDLYREEFEKTYDGTYESLQKLLDLHPDLSLGAQAVGFELVQYWLGYRSLFNLGYQIESGKVVDITKQSETKELIQTIYSDILAGRLIVEDDPAAISTDLLAFEKRTKGEDIEGFTRYLLLPNLYTGNFGSYGIATSSTKKDLVIQVLGVCYSDPELASMIEWREAYAEEWLSITEARKTAEPTALTGFIPELTAEELEALYNYGKDTDGICSKMFKTDSRGKRTVDPGYLTYLDKFFEEPKDYGSLFNSVNKQLEERCDK